jgi:putative ABC transport system permease protein
VKEIIGVARQVKGRPDEKQELVQLYAPLAQHPYTDTYLVMRTAAGPPEALVPAIRALVARRDPTLSVRRIRTLETLVEEQTAGYQFRAIAVAAFAALALVLAMVGVFGVLAYAVQQRHREFGIRMALGAGGSDLLKLVVGSAARVIAAGAVVGLVLAGALSRTIASFLFGVQPLDPVTFLAVPLVMTVTAILATAVPALRAVRVDPVTAIRE